MCLSKIFTDEETEEWLVEQPEVLTLEKGVSVYAEYYGNFNSTCSFACDYVSGLNIAKPDHPIYASYGIKYWPNYHFYQKAPDWMSVCGNIIIKCLVNKSWVKTIGKDSFGRIVIVADQAVFPHYPETEARYEDLPQEKVKETVDTQTH